MSQDLCHRCGVYRPCATRDGCAICHRCVAEVDWTPRCLRCGRVLDPWPLRRADVCSPKHWARCIRGFHAAQPKE